MKNIFWSENLQFLEMKFSIYLNRRVFIMTTTYNENVFKFLQSTIFSTKLHVRQAQTQVSLCIRTD